MRGRSGVANRGIPEGCCITVNAVVIGVKALSQSVLRDTASVGFPFWLERGAPGWTKSTFAGEFRGVGHVEFVDLVVDLGGRETG